MVVINESTIGAFARNLARNSQELSGAHWSTFGSGTRANQTTVLAPDGTATADLLDDNDAVASYAVHHDYGSLTNGLPYAGSIFVHAAATSPSTRVRVQLTTGADNARIVVDPATGAVISTVTTGPNAVVRVHPCPLTFANPDGWFRIEVVMDHDSAEGSTVRLELAPDVETAASQNAAVFWGAQFEQAARATPYQPQTDAGGADQWTGTYATLTDWFTNTDNDLVFEDKIEVGRLLPGRHVVAAGVIVASGAITDSTRYRHLTSVSGSEFKPDENGPTMIEVQWGPTGDQDGVLLAEAFFRLSRVGIYCSGGREVTAGHKVGISVQQNSITMYQVFLRISEGRFSTTSPLFTGVRFGTTAGPTYVEDFYCREVVVQGDKHDRGAGTAFMVDVFTKRGKLHNCVAHNITGGGALPRGYWFLPAIQGTPAGTDNVRVVNCIATNCKRRSGTGACFQGTMYSDDSGAVVVKGYGNCISSDSSLYANNFTGDSFFADPDSFLQTDPHLQVAGHMPGAIWGVSPSSVFIDADRQNFKLTGFSPALEAGQDLTTDFEDPLLGPGNDSDVDGVPRGAVWDIGAYSGRGTVSTAKRLVATSLVGSAQTGRHFVSIQDWIDSLPGSLAFANVEHIAEIYDDLGTGIDLAAAPLRLVAIVTSAARRLTIRANDAQRWAPFGSGRGLHIKGTGGAAPDHMVVDIRADNVTLEGFRVTQETTATVARKGVWISGHGCIVDSLFVRFAAGTTATTHTAFELEGSRCIVRNLIAQGKPASAGNGASRGIYIHDCDLPKVLNCLVHDIDGPAPAYGVQLAGVLVTTRPHVANVISLESGSADFRDDTTIGLEKILSHCTSSDATAVGEGAVTSATAATLFLSPSTNDFRLLASSSALHSGLNTLLDVPRDFEGRARTAPVSRGVYEGFAAVPLTAKPEAHDSFGMVRCVEVVRKDGVAIRVTENSEPIPHNGQIYSPAGGMMLSSSRSEAGLRPSSSAAEGIVSSDKITEQDLAAGRYEGARVRVFFIDPIFPFAAPRRTDVWTLGRIKHSDASWSADLDGALMKLDRNTGENRTIECGYDLGDDDCGKDIFDDIEGNVRVDGAPASRTEFVANAADYDTTKPDDYFGNGRLMWLTGANAGLTARVKGYIKATRTFTLTTKMPLAIADGDRFSVKPGCRKRPLEDCRDKFANLARFGGAESMPGGDRTLEVTS